MSSVLSTFTILHLTRKVSTNVVIFIVVYMKRISHCGEVVPPRDNRRELGSV